MNYQTMYQEKLTSAQEAVRAVRSGDWVDYGWCVGTPRTLDKALAERYQDLTDVKIRGGVLFEKPAVMQVPETAEHFTWNSWHMSGVERKMIADGATFYAPMRYSELPRFYRENVSVDVVMIQVAPMDDFGYFNFGPSASHLKAACDAAKTILVEVNRNMPRCLGGFEEGVHILPGDPHCGGGEPAMWRCGRRKGPHRWTRLVAKLIVSQIPDGLLALGIGGMPNAVGSMIAQSESEGSGRPHQMYVDGFVDIAMAGKITGSAECGSGTQTTPLLQALRSSMNYLAENPPV